jgi:nucleolar GTP-binding protein
MEAAAYDDAIDAEEAEELAAAKARKEALPKPAKTARDLMWEAGGPGVHSVDLREHYRLHNEEWVNDVIPEIMDGKNIADFVDPDIELRLEELEREEEELRKELEGTMETEDVESDLDEEEKETIKQIREARARATKITQEKKKKNAKRMPRAATEGRKSREVIQAELEEKGYDASKVRAGMKRKREDSHHEDEEMDVEPKEESFKVRTAKRGRHDPNPGEGDEDPRRGVRTGEMYKTVEQKDKAMKKFHKARSVMRMKGQLSEGDRFTTPKLTKHLMSGKRGIGKTDSR